MMKRPARLPPTIIGVVLCAFSFFLCACGRGPETYSDSVYSTAKNTPSKEPQSGRYDLAQDERRGGHTLSRHVGRSDEELRQRLEREKNISAASTWTDRETAEVTVAAGLDAEGERVARWERRGERRTNLALHFAAGRAIGRSLRRGEQETVPCSEAVIVLRADGMNNFYVLTTYPEARR
jgi:hypothetical protein